MVATPLSQRELSADVVLAALEFVERLLGPMAVAAVVEAAGFDDVDELRGDPLRWFSHAEVLAIAEAGAAACHETNFGRRTGEQLIASTLTNGTAAFMRPAGSIAAVLPQVVNAGNRMAASRILRLVEVGESTAVIEARWLVIDAPPSVIEAQRLVIDAAPSVIDGQPLVI
jgi:hypothetical protein